MMDRSHLKTLTLACAILVGLTVCDKAEPMQHPQDATLTGALSHPPTGRAVRAASVG